MEVSFTVKNSDGSYMLYAGSGQMKCFECGNVGRKCFACSHKQQVAVPSSNVVSGFVLARAAADTNIASSFEPLDTTLVASRLIAGAVVTVADQDCVDIRRHWFTF